MNLLDARVLAIATCLFAAHGCSAAQPPQAAPPSAAGVACEFVGLETVQGPSDQNSNAVTLFAVYRFPEPETRAAQPPWSLKFEVTRSRVGELSNHLASQREVLCVPDKHANYSARVEPFHGIAGTPEPNPGAR